MKKSLLSLRRQRLTDSNNAAAFLLWLTIAWTGTSRCCHGFSPPQQRPVRRPAAASTGPGPSSLMRMPSQVTNEASTTLGRRSTAAAHFPSSSSRRSAVAPLSLVSPAAALVLAETWAPKLGVVTCLALFLAPFNAVRDTIKMNQMCDLNPLPLALMSIVTVSWLAYGLALGDFYVAVSNLPGALLSLGYMVGILPVLKVATSKKELRTVQAILLLGAVSTLSLWTVVRFSCTSVAAAGTVLGGFASVFTVAMFGSPLTTLKTVVAERNSATLLRRLALAQIANSLLWTAYGITKKSAFVWAPNAAGLVLGLVQLAFRFAIPCNPSCEIIYDDEE